MKKQNLSIARFGTASVTPNHQKTYLFNFELDSSYHNLFAVTVINKIKTAEGIVIQRTVFCRDMTRAEMHKSGLHFNTIQPDHKARFKASEWKHHVNKILGHLRLEIPEVIKCKKN